VLLHDKKYTKTIAHNYRNSASQLLGNSASISRRRGKFQGLVRPSPFLSLVMVYTHFLVGFLLMFRVQVNFKKG